MRKAISKTVYYVLLFFISTFFFLSVLKTFNFISIKTISFYLYLFGFLAFIIYILLVFKCKIKINKYDFFIYIMIAFGIISTIFSYNLEVSIFGFPNRYEGLLSLLSYYFLFLISRELDPNRKNKIILLILLTGVFNLLWGVIQLLSFWFNVLNIADSWYYARGFLGNSNFFGTYMVICYTLSLYFFKQTRSNFFKALFVLFILGIIISGALSAYLSGLCIFLPIIIEMVTAKFKNKYTNHLCLLTILVTLLFFTLVSTFITSQIKRDLLTFSHDVTNIAANKVNQKTASSRLYIWHEALKYYPNYIVTGLGIDNFYYINNGNPIRNNLNHELYDKAHNEFLQIFTTEGILMLISYLIFLYNLLKDNRFNKESKPLLMTVISYQIQAFFNISIIRIAPINYIIMGFLASYDIKAD